MTIEGYCDYTDRYTCRYVVKRLLGIQQCFFLANRMCPKLSLFISLLCPAQQHEEDKGENILLLTIGNLGFTAETHSSSEKPNPRQQESKQMFCVTYPNFDLLNVWERVWLHSLLLYIHSLAFQHHSETTNSNNQNSSETQQ